MPCVCFGAPCRKDVHIPDLYIDDSPYHSAVTHDMITVLFSVYLPQEIPFPAAFFITERGADICQLLIFRL